MDKNQHVDTNESVDKVIAELVRTTAKIKFNELQRYFAQGILFAVAEQADLIEVASKMVADDKNAIAGFLEQGTLERVHDDMAREWLVQNPTLWCVVVAPYVLVQYTDSTQDSINE